MNRVEALTAWFEYQKTATNEFSLRSSPFSLTIDCVCFSLFWPQKVRFKAKSFLTFMMSIFQFCPWKYFKEIINRILLLQNCRNFQYILPCQPNGPKNSKDTRFIWVFIILGIFDFGQGSQLEGENLPSRPISSSSSLLHPYYSENFKKIPRSRSNPKTPCRNSVGQSPLTCSKKVIQLSFYEKIHYIKSSSFSSDI